MTIAILAAWILLHPPVLDGHGHPIPRPADFATTTATVVLEHPDVDPRLLAATLDVIAAHESGYRPNAVGDHGRSVGRYQSPAASTPKDALGQTREAVKWILVSWSQCAVSGRLLNSYSAGPGHCNSRIAIAERYMREIQAELLVPLTIEGGV